MILFTASRYLRYILFSGHRKGHGINSPFVYDLVSRIFRNKSDPEIVIRIKKTRRKMISDCRSIFVNDLGAGSERRGKFPRRVSAIAKTAAVPEKYGILLYNISKEFGSPLIIELGTSLGISAMYLAAASADTIVYTIEGCKETSAIARQNFGEAGFENIKVLNGSFDEMLPVIRKLNRSPGLVFIDGHHKKGPLVRYFNILADMSDRNSVIIIDDINGSREMAEAWNMIKNYDKVTVTIDIFRMGIVFFRTGICRKNHIIRY